MNENGQQRGASGAALVPAAVTADQFGHLEARVRSEIQARTALAVARPRDMDEVRERILRDARRPGLAAVVEYAIPRAGTTIRGPSIRFAESVARALGNVAVDVTIIHEDDAHRLCEVSVVDLESNVCYRQAFQLRKVMERRKLPANARQEDVVGTRVGADGQTLYLMRASEQDLAMQQAAQASRVIRGLILRVAPGDIVEEALQAARATREREDSVDPAAAKRRIADAFATIGVTVAELKRYLGHPLDQCSPAELDELRGIWAAIRDGQTTWPEVAAAKAAEEVPQTPKSTVAEAAAKVQRAVRRQGRHGGGEAASAPDQADGGDRAAEQQPQPSAGDDQLSATDQSWITRLVAECPHLSDTDVEAVLRETEPDPAKWPDLPVEGRRVVRRRCWDMEAKALADGAPRPARPGTMEVVP